ncbi:YbgA family protein [Thermoflexus hugenholtzii]
MGFPRPRVVVSACLGFAACRYDGSLIPHRVVEAMGRYVEFIPVCPEVEIGLGTPRPPVRLVQEKGTVRLMQPDTGKDLTEAMQRFARAFLDRLPPVDGFLLKNRSPSCAVKDAMVYTADGMRGPGLRAGLFAEAVLERFGDLPVEDEGRLTNRSIREHFFTAIFALAALRETLEEGRMKDLVAFHTRYKLLLMAYSPRRLGELGRIVANPERAPLETVRARYAAAFRAALRHPPRRPTVVNALLHAFGYFSDRLSRAEKAHFLEIVAAYRARRLPLSTPLALLRSWTVRFDEPYLRQQAFLLPFPEELSSLEDSGRGEGWV